MIAHLKAELNFCSKQKLLGLHFLYVSIQISATICMQNKLEQLSLVFANDIAMLSDDESCLTDSIFLSGCILHTNM